MDDLDDPNFTEKIKLIGEILDCLPFYAMLVEGTILSANNKVEEFDKDIEEITGEYCQRSCMEPMNSFQAVPKNWKNVVFQSSGKYMMRIKDVWSISSIYLSHLRLKGKWCFFILPAIITERKTLEKMRKEWGRSRKRES